MDDKETVLRKAEEALGRSTPELGAAELGAFVASFIERRDQFLSAVEDHGSPLYLLERSVLRRRAERFMVAFRGELPDMRAYYALKSNGHPALVSTIVESGMGLDVSSGLELTLALDRGAEDIVFSGPGKTDEELALAVEHAERVVVLMDSFGELARLERVAAMASCCVRAGVRLCADEQGLWRKFGIPLGEIRRFFRAASESPNVRLCGLQFHTSWNLGPERQVGFIARLGEALEELDPETRGAIEFIDVGGGFWPERGEWIHASATPPGQVRQAVCPQPPLGQPHCRLSAAPIETFARAIGDAVRKHLFPHVRCRICAEPGRWICNDAMHIAMTVVDRKNDDLIITDAGTNAVGWERFEVDYFPIINLSRPGTTERPCYVLGSLCTPHDVWGYAFHGEGIQVGDILLVPTQGAYAYSLRQTFIKPLPEVVLLD